MATAAAAAAAAASPATFTNNPLYTGGDDRKESNTEEEPLAELDGIAPQATPENMQILLENAYPALKGDPKLLAKLAAQIAADRNPPTKRRINLMRFNALPKKITTPGATSATTTIVATDEQSPVLGAVAPHQGQDFIANQIIEMLMTQKNKSHSQCRKMLYALITTGCLALLSAASPAAVCQ
jgi:hypothetical protein